MQRIFALILIISLLSVPVGVYAQTSTPSTEESSESTTERLDRARELQKSRRDNIKNALQETKQEFKEQLIKEREEAKERFKSQRQEFKEKLDAIKDLEKKAIVERIDLKISNLNSRHTEKLAGALDRLQTFLDKISSEGAQLKTNGTDTSVLDSAVTSAQTAVNSAKNSVSNQSAEIYVIELSDEEKLGQAVSPVVKQFRSDIQLTHQAVVAAKNAVQKAGVELGKLKGDSKSATNSAASE